MKRDLINYNLKSSFQSIEKDTELILRKLFIENKPLSEELKKLILINTKDCLDSTNNLKYKEIIDNTSIKNMIDEQYIRLAPKVKFDEHE